MIELRQTLYHMHTVINYSDELFHEKIKWCQETGNGYMVEFNTLEEFLNFSDAYKKGGLGALSR